MKSFKEYFNNINIVESDNELDSKDIDYNVTIDDVMEIIDFLEEYYIETDDSTGLIFLDLIDVLINSETQQEKLNEIYHTLNYILTQDLDDDSEEDELDETTKIKRHIPASVKLKRKQYYKRNKAKLKIKQQRYKKTSGYKKWKTKYKRKSKSGYTATGKRQTKFI